MEFTVYRLGRWDERLDPLIAESRALPDVPADEAAPFREWVDSVAARMAEGRIPALVACEDGRPMGLIGYTRRGSVARVLYLYTRSERHESVSDFLLRAEDMWQPVLRVVVEGGPQTLLDEAVGAEGFLAAGYRRFERARLERPLSDPIPDPGDDGIIRLPTGDEAALAELQRVGYRGSPDELLIDDLEHMVSELLNDPAFCPQASFAVEDAGRLLASLYTYRRGPLAWVASLCVRPEARGRRLAQRLMNHALRAYSNAGFQRAGLHVTLANRPAITLYEKMGFHLAERISLLYAKQLTPRPSPAPSSAVPTAEM